MTVLLHIQSASQQFSDTEKQQAHDLEIILQRQAHFVGTSEVGTPEFRQLIREYAQRYGYTVMFPECVNGHKTNSPILVRNDLHIVQKYYIEVIPPYRAPAAKGGHSCRGINVVQTEWRNIHVSLVWAHWLSKQDVPERAHQNMKLTRAVCAEVKHLGQGTNIVFWGGDINWDEDDPTPDTPGAVLKQSGLISIFEELNKPDLPTHGTRTIDLIGSYAPDNRVSAHKVKVWNDREEFTNIDHNQVSGWYAINI